MQKEARIILKNMTLVTFLLLLALGPLAFYWGKFGAVLGLIVGFVLSLGNFYGSIYSFTFAFRKKKENHFPFSRVAGLILLGFWVRLGVIGVILFLLAKISKMSMFSALIAFILFYGILFVSEMRLLSKSVREFS